MGSGVAASRKWSRARSGFRAPREPASVSSAEQPSGLSAWCGRRYSTLTTSPEVRCSWESEQSKNGAGDMVPLYAARVQDLGPVSVNQFSSSNLVSGGFPDSLSFRPIALLERLPIR